MMRINFVTSTAFDELCRFVCYQLEATGSESCDRETLYFAIYWQICTASEQEVEFDGNGCDGNEFRIPKFQRLIENSVAKLRREPFDPLPIINKNVDETIDLRYAAMTAAFR